MTDDPMDSGSAKLRGIVFLDTETTGLDAGAAMVSIAVVNGVGEILLSTLLNPGFPIPPDATAIHGITDAMVATAPTASTVVPFVAELVTAKSVVIYNAAYDSRFLDLSRARAVRCCMERFAKYYGAWNETKGGYRWQKLSVAASVCGHTWTGAQHGALADAFACLHVWRSLPALERTKAEGLAAT